MNRSEGVELIHDRASQLAVSMPPLHVEVRDDEIIVTQSGSKFKAVYHSVHHMPSDQPQLIVKGTPNGNYDFLAQAWEAANNKARELGWIV
jgi:hypothetical protein